MKKLFVIIICMITTLISYSQLQDWEVGIMIGGSNYVGDINNMFKYGNDDSKELNQFESSFNMYNAHLVGGIIARYNLNVRWVFRGSLMFSKLSGNDSHFKNERNLSFYTNIQEIATCFEFNFFDYKTGSKQHRVTPYLFGGIALFHFNPKTQIKDYTTQQTIEISLHDMHTEGQTFLANKNNYNLWQLSIPFGLGIKFSLSKHICLGIEWGFRKTFTDYIDDISTQYVNRTDLMYNVNENAVIVADRTNELDNFNNVYHSQGEIRGNENTKDWYNFFGFTLTTKLSNGNKKCLKR